MIDIHSHLIFDVDDGPSTFKESLRMALTAEKLGFDIIVATPHYSRSKYPEKKLQENFSKLASSIIDCDIQIRLGCEVMIDDICFEGTKERTDLTLDRTKYMLFELPFDLFPPYIDQVILDLHGKNITPIIAHPERYRYFFKELNTFISVIERGCLVQIDAGSVLGVYGSDVRKFTKTIVKLGLANFIASDAHCPEDYENWYPASYEQVKKWVGKSNADMLFQHNPKRILFNS